MKKITISSKVVNGNLATNRRRIKEIVSSFEGLEIDICFSKKRKKRSNEQNAYYWGVIIPLFQQGIKECFGEMWDINTTHEHIKSQFNKEEKVNIKTSEVVQLYKSTTENSTIEMEEYHEKIRNWMLENMDIICPLPNEDLTLFQN